MRTLTWLLGPLLFLVSIPLAVALAVTTLTAPFATAASSTASNCTVDVGGGSQVTALPAAGTQRRASLTNPPTDIPADVQALYQQAATRYGLPWTLLAGVGMAETNHGRNTNTSTAGAQGLMQFLPATFTAYGVDGDGDNQVVITADADSIHTAAHYLVASGALTGHDGVRAALYAYNHATWYLNDVLYYAAHYTNEACQAETGPLPDTPTSDCPPSGSPAERGLQPAALRALRCVKQAFPWITNIGGVGDRPNTSDHPAGRAVDFMIPNWNTPHGNNQGWQVAEWLQTNATNLRIKYVIYDDKVWRSYRPTAGWNTYTHPNGPTTNPTLRHLDHVHVSHY